MIVLTAQQAYGMLENQTLWQTARHCHQLLKDAQIPHALVGGVAVCLHGYQRNTVDLDWLIRKEDCEQVRAIAPSQAAIRFLVAGERAGADSEVVLPDPADPRSTTEIEQLPVLKLARLIETKIACGAGNLRRTHKDFADVIELINHNRLDSSFARHVHKSLRATYRKLVRTSRGQQ